MLSAADRGHYRPIKIIEYFSPQLRLDWLAAMNPKIRISKSEIRNKKQIRNINNQTDGRFWTFEF